MKWISVKEQAIPTDRSVLVWSDYCKSAHTSVYDYNDHILEEYCYENGNHFPGASIEKITHWMDIPKPPKDSNEMV